MGVQCPNITVKPRLFVKSFDSVLTKTYSETKLLQVTTMVQIRVQKDSSIISDILLVNVEVPLLNY